MFWSSEKLKIELPRLNLIHPYDEARVKHGAYELALGSEAAVSRESTRIALKDSEQVCIPPGQFAHLLTLEVVEVPLDTLALISIKSGVKQTGLINVSGFHVDPGFKGHLVFSVYNAGVQSIVLSRGEPVFLMWFAASSHVTADGYSGGHKNQAHISDAATMALHGISSSPPEIAHRLTDLEARVGRWFSATKWIMLTLLSGVIALTMRDCRERNLAPRSVVLQNAIPVDSVTRGRPQPSRESAESARAK